MEQKRVMQLLNDFKDSKITVEKALEQLKTLPFEDIGFAKVDHHRAVRRGFAEVVLCSGKTIEQITGIFRTLEKKHSNLLLTRADETVFKAVKKIEPKVRYNKLARTITLEKSKGKKTGNILVVSAGTADMPVAEEAAETAEIMGNNITKVYDAGVAGLQRILAHTKDIFSARCIIVVAGMDGALASVVGGLAPCPVIAVPTSIGYGISMNGIAALLSMLNSCSPNVTVVNIDNGFGAGYTASLINKETL